MRERERQGKERFYLFIYMGEIMGEEKGQSGNIKMFEINKYRRNLLPNDMISQVLFTLLVIKSKTGG